MYSFWSIEFSWLFSKRDSVMRSFLYHDSNQSRPVIYLLKYFCLWFRLCKYICISQILCGVIKQKSHVSRDFRPLFVFYDLNPSGPLINRIKYFWIRFRFHWDIQIFKKLLSVHHTAESSSAVCIIPRSQAPRCASYPGVRLRSVHHITESWKKVYKKTSQSASYQGSDSTVWIILRSQKLAKCLFWSNILRLLFLCDAYHGVKWPKFFKKLHGVHHSAK